MIGEHDWQLLRERLDKLSVEARALAAADPASSPLVRKVEALEVAVARIDREGAQRTVSAVESIREKMDDIEADLDKKASVERVQQVELAVSSIRSWVKALVLTVLGAVAATALGLAANAILDALRSHP